MAKYCGFVYDGKDDENNMVVIHKNKDEVINKLTKKLHYVLEFTSKRKRQSVIVEDLNTHKIIIMTKGADSVVMERTNKG